jgi:molecular chaperone GrpE
MRDDKREMKKEYEDSSGTGKSAGSGADAEKGTLKDDAEGVARKKLHQLTKKELEERVLELEKALSEERKRAGEYLDDAQRIKAELENYRKRMVREQTRLIDQANRSLILKLLPVIDNLEKAIASTGANDLNLNKGIRMVYDQLMDVLSKEGLEVIDPHGHPFDPEVCEAVMAVVSDDHEDETVVEVHQKGYKYRGSLLRPARATVSKCG